MNPKNLKGNLFFEITKIVDTSALKSIYLGEDSWNFMKKDGSLKIYEEDGPHGFEELNYNGLLFKVVKTPENYPNANIAGWKAIFKLELHV